MDSRIGQSAIHFAVVSAIVLGAYGLTDLIEVFLHPQMLFDIFGSFHLVYLPHGALILLAWFYGWVAIPLVLPATFLVVAATFGTDGLTAERLLLVTLKAVVVPMTFELFRITGIDARGAGMALNWRVLFLIGLVAATFNNLLRYWMGCCGALTAQELLLGFTGAIIGDMVGLAVVMVAAVLFFRALRSKRA